MDVPDLVSPGRHLSPHGRDGHQGLAVAMSVLIQLPALQFLLLGGLLFLANALLDPWAREGTPSTDGRIVISSARIEALRKEWFDEHGSPPDRETTNRIIDEAIDEEILVREATTRGLGREDRLVRERLAQLTRFLTSDRAGEGENGTNEAALEEARHLGLERHDVVIRRHLVQTMRLFLSALPASELPSPTEIEAYRDAHVARFSTPERIQLTHVYLSAERRGGHLSNDAEGVLAVLERSSVGPRAARNLGDPFIQGEGDVTGSRGDFARLFGRAFAQEVWGLEEGKWLGPVRSAFGVHLVFVHEHLPAQAAPVDAVGGSIAQEILRQRRAERVAANLRGLRLRYEVTVERTGADSSLD